LIILAHAVIEITGGRGGRHDPRALFVKRGSAAYLSLKDNNKGALLLP
jgi:hypothetical protein